MRLLEPTTVAEAIAFANGTGDARFLAGGQTLVAMMNAELVEPEALISLRRIAELGMIARHDDGAARIGAMATHAAIAACRDFSPAQRILAEAARVVAHPAVRNAGTIGGAIAHADPAADYPAALSAAAAAVHVAGSEGERTIPVDEFFVDYLETALEDGEMVTAVELPAGPPGAVAVYEKVARVDGDFATLSLALVAVPDGDGFAAVRLALGSAGPTPVRAAAAEAALTGRNVGAAEIAEAAAALVAASDPVDDLRGSAAYRRRLVPGVLARAIAAARRG